MRSKEPRMRSEEPRWHEPPADELVTRFVRALRHAGLRVTSTHSQMFLEACVALGTGEPHALYWAGRGSLCSRMEDIPVFDLVFAVWFGPVHGEPETAGPQPSMSRVAPGDESTSDVEEAITGRALASRREVLRRRDLGSLGGSERDELARFLSALSVTPPRRRAARWQRARRGPVDLPHTLRQELRRWGEPVRMRHRRRGSKARRVVLLIDVSGSMSAYAESFLRLAHRVMASSPRTVEVFTLGTRLTRVSGPLRTRDPDVAVELAGDAVPDWQGGTRLGEGLTTFLRAWGQSAMVRGAVVIVFSDGLERGDTSELAAAMRHLHRLSHRVIWVNPHRGKPGYEPVQAGMAAALPHVDRLVAGHTLSALEALTGELARA